MQFLHFGVPTAERKPDTFFIEGLGVHVTAPDADPFQIEWLRFEPDSPMHEAIKTKPHVAYKVDDLEAVLQGKTVICDIFSPGPGKRLAFIDFHGAVIELYEEK
ncbi:MAG: hypothetical protein LBN39_03295 [Planctomycetaceae bacterium]|jgi:hypothetical protein|nr:hypothetical protein [Planctomycetaceae bacterium]